jgi:hypothetical protein
VPAGSRSDVDRGSKKEEAENQVHEVQLLATEDKRTAIRTVGGMLRAIQWPNCCKGLPSIRDRQVLPGIVYCASTN